MTTLMNRPGTVVIIVDVQAGVVANAHERNAVIANIRELIERARAADTPVIWIQHSDAEQLSKGSDAWQIVAELRPAGSDRIVEKEYGDAFEETDLEDVLARLKVGRIILAGAQTDACIRSTLHGAFVRGYDVTLVGDAHTTEDLSAYGAPGPAEVIAHTNLYWKYHSAPGRTADTVSARDVTFNH